MSTAYPAPTEPAPHPRAGEPPSHEEFVALHVGGSIQVKPVPVSAVRRFGPRPLRVLLFGGGPLIGWGLRDHNVGLAGNVADQLAAVARRGVQMEVVADGEPARQAAIAGFRGLRLWRFDAIVVVLGQPGKGSVQDQAYWTAELVRALLVDGAPTAALSVYDSSLTAEPPRSVWARPVARHSQAQRDAAEIACARTGRIRFGELASPLRVPSPGRPFEPMQFAHWAEQIVHRTMQQLDEIRSAAPTSPVTGSRHEDERFRQRALESLRIGRDANERLDWLVNAALTRFGAAGAAINLIDGDAQWSKASVPSNPDLPRDVAYCAHAIQQDGSTLINDARLDERLVGNPLVERVRFYAAHPIRSWDGYRIGTLCVYGSEPRTMRLSDLAPLQDLAGCVEQELWSSALRPHGDQR